MFATGADQMLFSLGPCTLRYPTLKPSPLYITLPCSTLPDPYLILLPPILPICSTAESTQAAQGQLPCMLIQIAVNGVDWW